MLLPKYGYGERQGAKTSRRQEGSEYSTSLRIIGVGNRYRGDDAVGLVVAERLRQRLGDAVVTAGNGEPAALMEMWGDTKMALVIDAMVSGRSAGTVYRHDVTRQPLPADLLSVSTHGVGLGAAIELARALRRLPPRLIVYGIEIESATFGARLSPSVAVVLQEVVDEIASLANGD